MRKVIWFVLGFLVGDFLAACVVELVRLRRENLSVRLAREEGYQWHSMA